MKYKSRVFKTLERVPEGVRLIDQRLLPTREAYVLCRDAEETAEAIRAMVVRGAPAIGCTAAWGAAVEAQRLASGSWDTFESGMGQALATLEGARPTAVNLRWAVERMRAVLAEARGAGASVQDAAARLDREARAIQEEDLDACRAIGRHGGALVPDRATVLTHCNAGGLATAGYGTALGVVRGAIEAGKQVRVLADETRPFLQGARLTAWELMQDGIETVLIADGAAASVMRRGGIDLVVVGADRIAANGDVANKIGTYGVALAAAEHRIPFYVAAPLSTIDLSCPSGDAIPIEERDPREVTEIAGARVAPEGVGVLNPAFDVTPARLIAAIVTERGVARPPFGQSLADLFR